MPVTGLKISETGNNLQNTDIKKSLKICIFLQSL